MHEELVRLAKAVNAQLQPGCRDKIAVPCYDGKWYLHRINEDLMGLEIAQAEEVEALDFSDFTITHTDVMITTWRDVVMLAAAALLERPTICEVREHQQINLGALPIQIKEEK